MTGERYLLGMAWALISEVNESSSAEWRETAERWIDDYNRSTGTCCTAEMRGKAAAIDDPLARPRIHPGWEAMGCEDRVRDDELAAYAASVGWWLGNRVLDKDFRDRHDRLNSTNATEVIEWVVKNLPDELRRIGATVREIRRAASEEK